MTIIPEKHNMAEYLDKYIRNAVSGISAEEITLFKRIPYKNDTVNVYVHKNIIRITYKAYNEFDWKFDSNSTCGDLIEKHVKQYSVKRVKNIVSIEIELKRKYKLKYYNLTERVDSIDISRGAVPSTICMFIGASIFSRRIFKNMTIPKNILFEIILNILNHNYRDHSPVELSEIIDFYKNMTKYDKECLVVNAYDTYGTLFDKMYHIEKIAPCGYVRILYESAEVESKLKKDALKAVKVVTRVNRYNRW